MRLTLIDEREVTVDATVDDDRVEISSEDLQRATGWELKPEGLCRGPVCVPVKWGSGERVDLSAFADALHRAFVVDTDGCVAALAGDPMSSGRRESIDELELSDLDGNIVRMSDFAGRKRLLVAWASW
jgi:hypothetical protein